VLYSISYGDASHVTFYTLSIGVSAAQSGLCMMHSIDRTWHMDPTPAPTQTYRAKCVTMQ